MKKVSKMLTGAVAAAFVTVSAAGAAEARPRWDRHHRGGIDAGDVIAGVAIIGGIAAIASAVSNSSRNRQRSSGYGYDRRGGEDYAVDACVSEAERDGRVQDVTSVDRRGDGYRVRGVIEEGYSRDGYNQGGQLAFTCTALSNGRISDFRINDNYDW